MLYCSAIVTNKILNKANIAIFFKFLLLAARDRGGGCASQLNLTHWLRSFVFDLRLRSYPPFDVPAGYA